ncbi:MAG: winged helix-turn-helix domain-containing protein [Planctomycetales bacterium]
MAKTTAKKKATKKTAASRDRGTAHAAAPPKSVAKKKDVAPAPKKMSALDAAAKVLVEAGEPLQAKAIIERAAAKGYWTSPGGATPWATIYSAMLREIGTKGKDARFKKTDRGLFAATGKGV